MAYHNIFGDAYDIDGQGVKRSKTMLVLSGVQDLAQVATINSLQGDMKNVRKDVKSAREELSSKFYTVFETQMVLLEL